MDWLLPCLVLTRHSLRTLGEIITEISYGQYKDAEGHDYVEMHETLITILKKTFMGYLVDLVPSSMSRDSVLSI